MNWGNAIVRSKVLSPLGSITTLEMELHLDGDFRKTSKKVTWLATPTPTYPLVSVTLLDYDYLITTPELDLNNPATASPSPERGWVKNDPALEEVVHAARVSVFRITGPLSPGGCSPGNRRGSPSQPGGSSPVK